MSPLSVIVWLTAKAGDSGSSMKTGIAEANLGWFERLSKVEVHAHLEGAVPLGLDHD